MHFINGLTIILIYQLLGEVAVRLLAVSVPGPVLGMLLLLLTLLLKPKIHKSIDTVADGLLSHLSLLFVPAGVGIMLYFNLIASQWVPIVIAILAGTMITMLVSAGTLWLSLRLLERPTQHREEK